MKWYVFSLVARVHGDGGVVGTEKKKSEAFFFDLRACPWAATPRACVFSLSFIYWERCGALRDLWWFLY